MELDFQASGRMRRLLRHRLLNIATGLKSANSLLASELDDRLTPREREYFPLIQRECDQIGTIVERFETLLGDLPPTMPTKLKPALFSILETFCADHPKAEVGVEFDDAVCDRLVCKAALECVLNEALENACEISGMPVNVSVRDKDGSCLVSIVDQGTGISEETCQMAFEPFYSTRARHMGVGLTIARKVVENRGGGVLIEPMANGNRMEFVLPYNG